MGFVKSASSHELAKAASVLRRIYDENPSHWPHGLSAGHFRPGDLFLVYKSASEAPVGFVGWQERDVEAVRCGFYSVGTLPEHRGLGVAKQAVAKLLACKSAGVDRVFALVVDGNTPSEKLASRLRIPILKAANGTAKAVAKALGTWGAGGTTTMLFQDNVMNGGEEGHHGLSSFDVMNNDTRTNLLNGLNFGLGAAGAGQLRKGFAAGRDASAIAKNPLSEANDIARAGALRDAAKVHGAAGMGGMFVGPMTKDLILDAHSAVDGIKQMGQNSGGLLKVLQERGDQAVGAAGKAVSGMSTAGLVGAAGIVAAGLAAAGYGVSRAIREQPPSAINMQQGGRLRVTLPTKNPGDAETTVELPYDAETSLTNALRNRIDLDTKRRLYAETRSRIHRRNLPKPDLQVN